MISGARPVYLLTRPDGTRVTFTPGGEGASAQPLTLELKKGGNAIRSSSSMAASAAAPAGAVAGGAVGQQVTILADVVAVDTKGGFVTLRGPKGNIVDLVVPDPGQLKLVKKGDQVEAVYTEAVAITVEPAAKPAKK